MVLHMTRLLYVLFRELEKKYLDSIIRCQGMRWPREPFRNIIKWMRDNIGKIKHGICRKKKTHLGAWNLDWSVIVFVKDSVLYCLGTRQRV